MFTTRSVYGVICDTSSLDFAICYVCQSAVANSVISYINNLWRVCKAIFPLFEMHIVASWISCGLIFMQIHIKTFLWLALQRSLYMSFCLLFNLCHRCDAIFSLLKKLNCVDYGLCLRQQLFIATKNKSFNLKKKKLFSQNCASYQNCWSKRINISDCDVRLN